MNMSDTFDLDALMQQTLSPLQQSPGIACPVNNLGRLLNFSAYPSKVPFLNGVTFSYAPNHGKNPGAVYVKVRGAYAGKILNERFMHSVAVPAETLDHIFRLLDNPLAEAQRYGQHTKLCACCGRDLTDDDSIQRGIGPTCARRWFGL